MPVEIEQLGDRHLLQYRFIGAITLDDLQQLREQETLLLRTLDPADDWQGIANFRQVGALNALLLPQFERLALVQGQGVRLAVVIAASAFGQALGISLGLMAGNPGVSVCATLGDALKSMGQPPMQIKTSA